MFSRLVQALQDARRGSALTATAGAFLVGAGLLLIQRYLNVQLEAVEAQEQQIASLGRRIEAARDELADLKARAKQAGAAYPTPEDLDPLGRGAASEPTDPS